VTEAAQLDRLAAKASGLPGGAAITDRRARYHRRPCELILASRRERPHVEILQKTTRAIIVPALLDLVAPPPEPSR
jgi:hypothetical protein